MTEYSDSKRIEAGTQTHWGTVPVAVIARRLNKLTLGATAWFVEQRLGVTLCRIYRSKRIRWILMLSDSRTTKVIGFVDISPRVEGQIRDLATAINNNTYKVYVDSKILERKMEVMRYLTKKRRRIRPSTISKVINVNTNEAYDELESMLHCGWVECGFDKDGTWFYADEMPEISDEPNNLTKAVSRFDVGEALACAD